ncbi:MAG: formylglycine-generating enzyme family protein [Prevotellaceae bacterium]|jgi:formylglycine-generating enzyme required for sulfatase activity|nr:formylglycine-generating enzyme family protein [Prevotellaceae bacterium]
MKQNYKIYLCALLLVGAVSMMTAGAQTKPKLAVFVVGMDNTLGDALATQIGAELNRNSRYTVLSSAADPVKAKLTELRTQGAGSIDKTALAVWGRANGVSTICLVTDDIKGNDNMFYALLIDTKDSKVSGKGSYFRTGVGSGEVARVSLALAKQLEGPGRRARKDVTPQQKWFEPEMVFVEGGTFTMGCVPARDGACNSNELPAHSVTLSSFYIGQYEVTQAQWAAVMGRNLPTQTDDQIPFRLSYYSVDTFLTKLNAATGKSYRLPTEAEWEYAARGGNKSQSYKYSGSNDLAAVAWCQYTSVLNGAYTHRPVGTRQPNELGIYDMSGNVWEWVKDFYDANYYATSPATNPQGPAKAPTDPPTSPRRGCCVDNNYDGCRIAARGGGSLIGTGYGFRVVLPAQ